MKKSIPLAKLVDKILPASLVPPGSVLPRFIPWMIDLTLATFEVIVDTDAAYADEVLLEDPAESRMYSLPTMIWTSSASTV